MVFQLMNKSRFTWYNMTQPFTAHLNNFIQISIRMGWNSYILTRYILR